MIAPGWRPAVVLVVAELLIGCTSSTRSSTLEVPAPTSGSSTTASPAVATSASEWPKHVPIVASIRAPEPPADDIRLFKPMLLAAYSKVCASVTKAQSAIRGIDASHRLILVRCDDGKVRGVRLTFTGVRVPDLTKIPMLGMEEPQNLLAMLGLRWHITQRAPVAGEASNKVVEQSPPPGEIVPFRTTVHIVVTK